MSLITNVEPQHEAAKSLLAFLLVRRIPLIAVRLTMFPTQVLVVFINETQAVHAMVPDAWSGYPVRIEGFGSPGLIN